MPTAVQTSNPASPYGTGVWVNQPSNYMLLVSGPDYVADCLITRLQTSYLFYDLSFGYDVDNIVGAANNGLIQNAMLQIEQQMTADPRVQSALAQCTINDVVMTIQVNVTLKYGEQFGLIGTSLANTPVTTFQWSVN
jgi:hypothetical protein